MTDVSTRHRVTKGVSTGGQFATEHRPEAHAVPPLSAMTVPETISAEKNAFFAAGGFEEGDHFELLNVRRDGTGTWTVEFREPGDKETGESYTARWHPETGYSQDDTARHDYYSEHIRPDRDDEDAFAQDLLGVTGGQEEKFFRRMEAQRLADLGVQHERNTATMRAQWEATGLQLNEYVGDYETVLSDAWRNEDGTWSLQYGTDDEGQGFDVGQEEDEPRVAVIYTIDPEDGLISTQVSPDSRPAETYPKADPFAGHLLDRVSGIEYPAAWAKDTEARWQAAGA